jgi:branched-chain amino acid transport system substrate-binding protein
MKIRQLVLAASMVATGLTGALVSTQAAAQAKEQFFPVLVYRTGAYQGCPIKIFDGIDCQKR